MSRGLEPTPTIILILAVILLFGVLCMAYGFYNSNSLVTYTGILITGGASWTIVVTTLTSGLHTTGE